MTWATRNENGDNMGNTMIQPALMPMDITKAEYGKRWDRIFNKPGPADMIICDEGSEFTSKQCQFITDQVPRT